VDFAVIGVDLGGTNVRAAVVNRDGEVLARHKEATRASEGRERVLSRLVEIIRDLELQARNKQYEVAGLGVGAPGVIEAGKGIVVKSPNLPDWNNFALRSALEAAVGLPVVLENDANAAALGEQWRGAGRGTSSMILLTLGTGVGGGIVLDGRIWRGADGMAGEIGHMTLFPGGRQCTCGNRGCLEMYASARGIVQTYREAGASGKSHPEDVLTSESIYSAAREGDRRAAAVMRDTGRFLGIGVASLINIFNPERIVIGGGVRDAWQLFIDAARDEVHQRAFEAPAKRAAIVPAELGDDAGMVGAAALAFGVVSGAV
jgi:glucokinase